MEKQAANLACLSLYFASRTFNLAVRALTSPVAQEAITLIE